MTNIRRSVLKRLARAIPPGDVPPWGIRHGLQALKFQMAELSSYEEASCNKLAPVFPAARSEVVAPSTLTHKPKVVSRPASPVTPILFHDVMAQSHNSLLRQGQGALVPPSHMKQPGRYRYEDNKTYTLQHGQRVFLSNFAKQHHNKAICAFGSGASNWYHWLIELLPMVMLAENLPAEFDDYPLAVPEDLLASPNFRDALDLFVSGRTLLPLPAKMQHVFSTLVVIPQPTHGPFNLSHGNWPVPEDYLQIVDVMQRFRSRILEKLDIAVTGDTPKHIFLARPPENRSYNQEEIIRAAEARGLVSIRPETLSFRDQVQLFHNADVIVGPTGAAFANSLFCRPGTTSVSWMLRQYSEACAFSNIAHLTGADMSYCFVEADKPVENTDQAFFASYKLPLEVFEAHLDTVLTDRANS